VVHIEVIPGHLCREKNLNLQIRVPGFGRCGDVSAQPEP